MKPQTRPCPKCGMILLADDEEWVHLQNPYHCKYTQKRFIKSETEQPLILRLNVKVNDKKTKKFLEDIMQEPVAEEKHDEWKEIVEGVVYTKTRINGIVKILKVEDFREHCDRLIKEMKDKETSMK